MKKLNNLFARVKSIISGRTFLVFFWIFFIFALGFLSGRTFNSWDVKTLNPFKHSLSKDDAYKAIVKVKTIRENSQFSLAEESSGSGVVITNDGLVLTNYHVVVPTDDYNDPIEAGYEICFPEDTGQAPECNYLAKLVSADKDLDLAILQIKPIRGLSKNDKFDYLDLDTDDRTNIGDEVIALGYPGIGEDTITITQGIISGKNDIYDRKWLKTDAVISFGNSGGAAVNSSGKVVGITSEAHSDTLGSLGYVININSINKWLSGNLDKDPQDLSFEHELIDFIKKRKEISISENFVNELYSIKRPNNWQFDLFSENGLEISQKSDPEGGAIYVHEIRQPYEFELDKIIPFMKENSMLSDIPYLPNIVKEENVIIGGILGKSISYYDDLSLVDAYFVQVQDHLIAIHYFYGEDDKNKKEIDEIISSFTILPPKYGFGENKIYRNKDPEFRIEVADDWALMVMNKKSQPAKIYNKKLKEAAFYIKVEKADESNKNFNNQQYIDDLKKIIEEINKEQSIINLEWNVVAADSNALMNKEIEGAMKISSVVKSSQSKKIEIQSLDYIKKIGERFIVVGVNLYSDDIALFNRAQAELANLLNGFSLQ